MDDFDKETTLARMNRLIEGEAAPPEPPRDPILEIVCALTDPIIVFPGGGWVHYARAGLERKGR